MIMDVRSVLEGAAKPANVESVHVELSGWLVIIGDDLYMLDDDLPDNYEQAPKIKLADWNIVYAVRQAILPLGGGESFVFHRAKVSGLLNMEIPPQVIVSSLYIQERGQDEFVAVDITQNAISAGKARYKAALNFDFFKEMGDI